MNIEQIMSRPVITARAHDTLNVAASLMWESDIGALPVLNDEGAVFGFITDRDICMAAYTTGRELRSITVEQAMAKKLISCSPTTELHDAEATMAKAQIRRLPVVDGQGRPVGMVSLNDIARFSQGEKAEWRDAVSTFAAICEPRRRAMQVA